MIQFAIYWFMGLVISWALENEVKYFATRMSKIKFIQYLIEIALLGALSITWIIAAPIIMLLNIEARKKNENGKSEDGSESD